MITTTKDEEQAMKDGYTQVTDPYELPQEQELLDRVIADMEKSNLSYRLVSGEFNHMRGTGLALWRIL